MSTILFEENESNTETELSQFMLHCLTREPALANDVFLFLQKLDYINPFAQKILIACIHAEPSLASNIFSYYQKQKSRFTLSIQETLDCLHAIVNADPSLTKNIIAELQNLTSHTQIDKILLTQAYEAFNKMLT